MKSWNGRVSSVALACARSTCSSPSTSRRVRSPSEPEEGGLMVALEVDVEAVAAVLRGGDQRRAAIGIEAREERVGVVGALLVGEVAPRRDAVQQPAREHRD